MADDSTIIEGTVKFRDGRKWKSRWCVMRKLSPVADSVQVQLYRDARARRGGSCKAALSLQHYLGCEAGFTLDKHSNTLALVCRDLVAVLAFDTRERLLQWQVKLSAQLGAARQFVVVAGRAAGGRLPAGPARLLRLGRRFALTAGVPPRLLGVWDLAHLRRYGVVEGRFCFEGGSLCGKDEGLHVLVTDQAQEIARDFDLASQDRLSPRRRPLNAKKHDDPESPKSHKAFRSDTRLSELNTIDLSLPPLDRTYDEYPREEIGAVSPYWGTERAEKMGLGDTASVHEGEVGGAWGGAALERCRSCMSKLGGLSRSSTAALTPGASLFSPAWTMDAVPARPRSPPPRPARPPRPPALHLTLTRQPRKAPPAHSCSCSHLTLMEETALSGVGPYDNYDVPKLPSAEVEGEYYDTPKRLKECLNNELFQMTKSSTSSSVVLRKPCGCLLRVGRRGPPAAPPARAPPPHAPPPCAPAACACARLSLWASRLLRRPLAPIAPTVPIATIDPPTPVTCDSSALYATVDLSRKTRRKAQFEELLGAEPLAVQVDDGPLANYENLNFALSLEHYENAKDLLQRAGVTQAELDAIGANLRPVFTKSDGRKLCHECGHEQPREVANKTCNLSAAPPHDDYLMMEPNVDGTKFDKIKPLPAGYTPMSPIGSFGGSKLRHPARSPINRLLEDKSASNPALCAAEGSRDEPARARRARRHRSSSADSSRFLDDVKELEGGSASSSETLRLAAAGPAGPAAPGQAKPNRDSSSSNDSGVSSWSLRRGDDAAWARLWARAGSCGRAAPKPRRSRSEDGAELRRLPAPLKSSSAEAEVPVLPVKPLRGVADTPSTSSGASDMSDYIETLSICSSHSSTDTPITMRAGRLTSCTLRPRSGKEYLHLAPRAALPALPPPTHLALPQATPRSPLLPSSPPAPLLLSGCATPGGR